ncbi:hypothetical protein LC612_29350 [Nostoc sp. CHAB 5834]|nr:hypothetical protein [Nostoc sp. CHAB 5834]
MLVYIHTGHLSVSNGAVFPLSQYFDFAKLLGQAPITGEYYGDDAIDIPDADWPVAEQILLESKMLYRPSQEPDWRNLRQDLKRH